ncbi:MAG: TonB family protein [Hyphomonas sp.]
MNRLKLPQTAPNCTIPLGGGLGIAAVPISRRSSTRLGLSCLLAGGITLSLFGLMQALIYVKDINVVEVPSRTLQAITPAHQDEPMTPTVRKPAPLQSVPVPPPLPQTQAINTAVGMPLPVIEAAAPAIPEARPMQPTTPNIGMMERRAEPLSPPNVQYPQPMAKKGLSGSCDVTFSLSIRGLPFNTVANCSHPGFESAALKAVNRAEFLPQVGANGPIEAHGMVYPIDFQLK